MIKFVFSLIWILLVATSGNACWTEHNFRGMVQDAQKLTPQNLQWVMDQYQDSFQRGLQQKHNGIRDREVLVQLIIKDSNSAITAFSKDMSYKKGAGFHFHDGRSGCVLFRLSVFLSAEVFSGNPHAGILPRGFICGISLLDGKKIRA